ncbi:MFS transporter [Bacteroidaceae bacterium HV4-6-C5C]|nr:MFS transporter [Bacteroidaceae bacterium HV4-6-C5C]
MNSYNTKKVFITACIGMCFFGISMLALGSVLPALTLKLGLNNLEATGLVTFLPLGLLGGSLLFGPIVDRFGYKTLLLLSCMIVLLGIEGIILFENISMLQLSIVGIGLGGGVLNGETNALVADISDEKEKGARISLLGAFYGIGALGIPTLLSALSRYYSFETILQAIGVIMLIGVIFCSTIAFPPPKQPQGFPIKKGLKLLKESSLIILSLILFFQSGIEGVCNNWTALYLGQVTNISSGQALITLTCMVAGLTATRLLLVVLFKRLKMGSVLLFSLIVAAVGFGLLSFSPGFLRAAIAMVLIGVGLASTFPVIFSIIGSKYASLSGTAFSIALVIALIGQTLLNSLTGIISQQYGIGVYPLMMIAAIAIMLLLFKSSLK